VEKCRFWSKSSSDLGQYITTLIQVKKANNKDGLIQIYTSVTNTDTSAQWCW